MDTRHIGAMNSYLPLVAVCSCLISVVFASLLIVWMSSLDDPCQLVLQSERFPSDGLESSECVLCEKPAESGLAVLVFT